MSRYGSSANKKLAENIDPSKMPAPKESYSEWITRNMATRLTQQNPEQGQPHVKQGKEILWLAFADWAMKNVEELSDTLYLYMQSQKSWIFGFFPIRVTKATKYMQDSMEVRQALPRIGTRKVVFPEIGMTITTREKDAVYTIQGFSMDYHIMKTEEGRVAWDRGVNGVTSNLWSFVIYQALNEMLFEPSIYRKMNQLYPRTEVPRGVNELMAWRKENWFCINKRPQSFHTIIAHAGRVMEQRQKKCGGLIVSRDEFWHAHGNDDSNCYFDKSGPLALSNRATAADPTTVDGAVIYPIPLGAGQLHDSTFTRLLQDVVQVGSFVRFPELTQNLPASEYTSNKRNIRFSSITRNGPQKYSLFEALAHSPEFVPLGNSLEGTGKLYFDDDNDSDDGCDSDSDDEGDSSNIRAAAMAARLKRLSDRRRNPAGKLNRELLYQLINRRKEIFKDTLRTALHDDLDGKNMDRLNQFIHYNSNKGRNNKQDRLQPGQQLYPVHVFGEIAECHLKTKYLAHVNATMAQSMFMGIDKAGITKFERGIRLAKELNTVGAKDDINIKEDLNTMISLATRGAETYFACANVENRGKAGTDDGLGCRMYVPSPQGGPQFDMTALEGLGRQIRPYGLGSIAGFLTLIAAEASLNRPVFNQDDMKVIRDFVYVYKQVVNNMRLCCRGHPALSPKLVPIHHNSAAMDDNTRILIAAWYGIFYHMTTPNATGAAAQGAPLRQARAGLEKEVAELEGRISVFDKDAPSVLRGKTIEKFYNDIGMNMNDLKVGGDIQGRIASVDTFLRALGRRDDSVNFEFLAQAAMITVIARELNVNPSLALHENLNTVARNRNLSTADKIGMMEALVSEWAERAKLESEGGLDDPRQQPPKKQPTPTEIMAAEPGGQYLAEYRNRFEGRVRQEVLRIFELSVAIDAAEKQAPAVAATAQAGESGFILTQFTFETAPADTGLTHAMLTAVPSQTAPLGVKYEVLSTTDATYKRMDQQDEQMFGGSLFTALPFIHPQLPALERSGDISASLRSRPEMGRVSVPSGRTSRTRTANPEVNGGYDSLVYTRAFYGALCGNELLLRYPEFITHIIANPLVQFKSTIASDFEARYMGTFAMSPALAAAARCVLTTPITLPNIQTMDENNIAIPLGAMLLRPFETQIAFSAIAITGEKIGDTNFSGFDNTVSFDVNGQHFNFQAFLWTGTMVSDNSTYLLIPCIRGGQFIGGKGHLFINQGANQPWQKLPGLIDLVSGCHQGFGENSIISVSDSYNNAIERQEVHNFDLRNNYRREVFAGDLHYAPDDFVEERQDLAYHGAPILNALFDWEYDDTVPMENRSFAQQMANRGRNYVLSEAQSEVWDGKFPGGWEKQMSYHVWDKTDTVGCLEVQQSLAPVVEVY